MRRLHFETLEPVCPVCRPAGADGSKLRLAHVSREQEGHVLEGALHCTNTDCFREYPIVDGVPLIISDIRRYVSDNILAIETRRDLSDFLDSILGDCCGPNSVFEITRQHLSSYAWDHYADMDPAERSDGFPPGSMTRNLTQGLELAGVLPSATEASGQRKTDPGVSTGPVIDLGCSVGRGTFALAEYTHQLVLGVDLNFPMLRLASEVLRSGRVSYPRRLTGLVYERREFPVAFTNNDKVDFWACDATALPFPAGRFGFAASMNLLDCVGSPRDLLVSLGMALRAGAKAVLSCPYDWSSSATSLEGWIGGHSQRSTHGGSCENLLRSLLTPGAHPGSVNTLKLIAEREHVDWHVRLHNRSTMSYHAHLLVVERIPG